MLLGVSKKVILFCLAVHGRAHRDHKLVNKVGDLEEEEEEEDLFVFNDTIEGPRAPAVKPGRVTQA